jgi:hypothetical protein
LKCFKVFVGPFILKFSPFTFYFTLLLSLITFLFSISATDERLRNLNGVTNRNNGQIPLVQKSPSKMDSSETMDNLNMGLDPDSLDNLMVEEEGYWREVKAIIGGVLGFWGGVGGLGTMFLIVVLSQRYCCKEDDDDKGDGDG